jgi:hypothetical protein
MRMSDLNNIKTIMASRCHSAEAHHREQATGYRASSVSVYYYSNGKLHLNLRTPVSQQLEPFYVPPHWQTYKPESI